MPRREDVDMSPRAIAARLATVSALNRLVQHLAAYRPAPHVPPAVDPDAGALRARGVPAAGDALAAVADGPAVHGGPADAEPVTMRGDDENAGTGDRARARDEPRARG